MNRKILPQAALAMTFKEKQRLLFFLVLLFYLLRFPVSVSRFVIPFDHTERHTTVGRTPLDEGSARRRDLYLTTHNTHNRHPCPRWDSNPRSQQASGRRPTPQTARLLDRLATFLIRLNIIPFFKNTGHTQKNGAGSIVFTIETAPLFCVYPVYLLIFLSLCRP